MTGSRIEDSDGKLSATLRAVSDSLPVDTVSLRHLLERMGEQGMLMLCALLTLPFMIPMSIPGVSTVFGLAILSIGIGVTFNRLPWLPRRILERPLPTKSLKAAFEKGLRVVGRFERMVRPRLLWVSGTAAMRFGHGLGLVLAACLLMLPFGLVPFSNTLPAVAVLLIALGLLERDGVFIVGGHVMNVATIVYFATLIAGTVAAGQGVFGLFR